MGKHTITIPDALYNKAQRVAQRTSQSVETVIRKRLTDALDRPIVIRGNSLDNKSSDRFIVRRNPDGTTEVYKESIQTLSDAIPDDIPNEEKKELRAMAYLSDDTLWTIAREQLQPSLQVRMNALMEKNGDGTIASDEYTELANLVERGERLILRKATAMRYLIGRGHQVTMDFVAPTDK